MKARGPFQGVSNIVRFNWPMYAASFGATLALGVVAASRAPRPIRLLAGLGGAGATWLSVSSLFASYWIYDRSALYAWRWLARGLQKTPGRILNIHAGFDESTAALRELFPTAEIVTADFYDPTRHSEPSIARARAAFPPTPETRSATFDHLPASDAWADLLVGFLAVHEIRDATERRIFFEEARRCCASNARFVLVEHLRDGANFGAFGPGFMHFHSRKTWTDAFGDFFSVADEKSITPFVRVFWLAPK